MNQLFKLKHNKPLDRGFTTVEILISIIIALAFISVAMQSFVLAMGMKVQAQEKQRANQLIQEDLERTNNLASNIALNNDKCNPVNYANGYAKQLRDVVGSTTRTTKLLKTATGSGQGETLTLNRNFIIDSDATRSKFPHQILKINYQVKDSDDNVIAERYVEVIPDVALRCP